MAALILPSRRVVQPQGPVEIDGCNAIARGLRYGVNFGAGSYDFVAGQSGAVADVGDAAIRGARGGIALIATDGCRTIQNPTGVLLNTGPVTHLALCEATAFDNFGGILSVANASSNAAFGIQQNGTTGNLIVYRDNDAGHSVTGGVSAITGAGKPLVIVARSAARAFGAVGSLSIDGIGFSTATLTSPGTLATGAVQTVYLGARNASTANSVNGKIYLHLMWDRYLTDAETIEVSRNPWQLFRPIQRRIFVAGVGGGGGVSGSLTATEAGSDTFASSGAVVVSGSLSVTETGADTLAASGSVVVSGSLAASESGSDTFSASGSVVGVITGSLAATEGGPDTFAATGTTTGGVSGSLNATEAGADTAALSGVVVVSGSLSATESGPDTFAASGSVVVAGSLAATESGSDTFEAIGFGGAITGALNATEIGSDTAQISVPRDSNLTQAAPGLIPKVWPSLWVRYESKPKRRIEELDEQERERLEEIAEQAVIEAASERTKKAMSASIQQAMQAAQIELTARSYMHLVEQAAALRTEQIEEEEIAFALVLM